MANNPISQALGGLTQYLMIENQRLDAEQKEHKINLAAEKIAEGYQNLPPDATIGDVQKLQFQLIEDAAALGGLQENMPLLSSLYTSTLNAREMEKMERRDSALYNYVSQKYGTSGISPELGGEAALKLHEFSRQGQRDITQVNKEGITSLTVFDEFMKPYGDPVVTNAVGLQDQFDWQKKTIDYSHSKELQKLQFSHNLSNPTPTASGPQIAGMDLYTNSQGVNGETLYKHHKNGGTYFLNKKTGQVEVYWGQIQKISTKTSMGQAKDYLATLQENENTFQPERLGLIQTLNETSGGKDFLRKLANVSKLPEDEDDGNLTMGAVTAVDNALRNPNIEKKLQTLYNDAKKDDRDAIGQVMQRYNANLSNQMNIENIVKDSMPNSPYDGPGLMTAENYERASMGLFEIFSGKVPDSAAAPLINHIAQITGVDPRNVNEDLFRTLGRQRQNDIMQRLITIDPTTGKPIIIYNK